MLRVSPTLRLPRGVHAPKITRARTHTHLARQFPPEERSCPERLGGGYATLKEDSQRDSSHQIWDGFQRFAFQPPDFKSGNESPLVYFKAGFRGFIRVRREREGGGESPGGGLPGPGAKRGSDSLPSGFAITPAPPLLPGATRRGEG